MNRRVLLGVAANMYGQAVTLAVQLVSVPVLLHTWGAQRYGLWLLAAAFPAALVLADGGITAASSAAVTAAAARGDFTTAAQRFRQALRFALVVAAAIVAAAGLVFLAGMSIADNSFRLEPIALVALLLCGGLLGLIANALDIAMRANGDYALGFAGTTSIRLGEAAAVLLAAISGHDLIAAALAGLATRFFGTLLFAALVFWRVPWVRTAPAASSGIGLRDLIRPALAALAVPVGLAVSLQGMTAVAGLVLPLALVPVFAASRTLTRLLVQAIGLFTHALMPEMTMAAGRGDDAAMATIRRQNTVVGALTLVPAWMVLLVAGPGLLSVWTRGALIVSPAIFGLMATAALLHGLWMSGANLLLAVNRQADYAYLFVAVSLSACLSAWALGALFGLAGLAGAAVAAEFAMAASVLPRLGGKLTGVAALGAATP